MDPSDTLILGGPTVVQAGDLLFTSAIVAAEYPIGLSLDARPASGRPFDQLPVKLQTRQIFRTLKAILEKHGSNLESLIKLDQFILTQSQATGYLEGRNEFLLSDRPCSVLVSAAEPIIPETVIQLDAVALAGNAVAKRETFLSNDVPYNASGGYSHAIAVGDLVFISGSVATDLKGAAGYYGGIGTAVAPEAVVDPNFWYGSEIKSQVEYTIRKKLEPMLKAGGASLDDIVQAQIYMNNTTEDWPAFREAWAAVFPGRSPAVSIYPVPSLGSQGVRIEICFIAVKSNGESKPRSIDLTGNAGSDPWPQATQAGRFIYFSTLFAPGGDERAQKLDLPPGLPNHGQPVKKELQYLLGQIAEVCADAGGSLDSVIRARVLLSDVRDFAPLLEAWREAFGDNPPALSPVVAKTPFPIPESRIAMDVVAHLDGRTQ